jgi:hypothetical protein
MAVANEYNIIFFDEFVDRLHTAGRNTNLPLDGFPFFS